MPTNIIDNDILEYVPKKTRHLSTPTKVRVPLDQTAFDLIEKYRGVDARGRLFPFLSPQKYNERIKSVLEKCGVNRIVQIRNPKTGDYESKPIYEVAASHMGRKTFIGVTYKLTHDPNIIGKMTGHVEGSKAFCRYRAIDDDDLRDISHGRLILFFNKPYREDRELKILYLLYMRIIICSVYSVSIL